MVSLSSLATEAECDRVWRATRLRVDVVVGVRQARVRDWVVRFVRVSEARDERQK
jgi:hypothetical protein